MAETKEPLPVSWVEAGDITVARKEVFGDFTSGWTGPTEEDYRIAQILNDRIRARPRESSHV